LSDARAPTTANPDPMGTIASHTNRQLVPATGFDTHL
jgi:hypothetical protein